MAHRIGRIGQPVIAQRAQADQGVEVIGGAIITALSSASGVVLTAEAFFAASAIVGTIAVGSSIAGAHDSRRNH